MARQATVASFPKPSDAPATSWQRTVTHVAGPGVLLHAVCRLAPQQRTLSPVNESAVTCTLPPSDSKPGMRTPYQPSKLRSMVISPPPDLNCSARTGV